MLTNHGYEREPTTVVSAPFHPGQHGQIAVKVVGDRGNELMVVKSLSEVER